MTVQGKANYEAWRKAGGWQGSAYDDLEYDGLGIAEQRAFDAGADAVEAWLADAPVDEDMPGNEPATVMHLMTIEMGAWCGASGPGNGRASSQWRDVTCPACTAKGMAWLRALVWDMLQAMPASHAALGLALRAGRLGVTDEQGRPLAMACTAEDDL